MTTPAPQQLAQFVNILTKVQDRNFYDTKTELPNAYEAYTKKGDTSRGQDYRSMTSVGLGQWQFTSEFGQFHKDAYAEGQTRVSTWVKFTNGISVSEELLIYMATNTRVYEDKVKMFSDVNQQFMDTWHWTKEAILAQFQTLGTSSTVTNTWPGVGRDGLVLFSASHTSIKVPTVTCSNVQGAQVLSQLALQEAITMLRNIVDDSGRPQGFVSKVIVVVGPYWQWRIAEILGTEKQVDTPNNNINSLTGGGKAAYRTKVDYIINPYLANSDTSWIVLDESFHQLMRFEAMEPMFAKEKDIATGATIFKSTSLFGMDFLSYRGAVKCAGA